MIFYNVYIGNYFIDCFWNDYERAFHLAKSIESFLRVTNSSFKVRITKEVVEDA